MEAVKEQKSARFYEFGPFVVDTAKSVLMRDGEIVPLGLKAFEILLALIRRQGQVLMKDELMEQAWPDTHVEESNLTRTVSTLRKALGESSNEHPYIATVPGRGYRFVASVRAISDVNRDHGEPAPDGSNYPGESEEARGDGVVTADVAAGAEGFGRRIARHKYGMAVALVAVIVVSVGAGLIVSKVRQRSQAEQPTLQRKLWQLTFDPGLESEPTWSPDGRMIAYSSDRAGNFDIWVQFVGEGNPVRVTNSPAQDWQPDWSPDGGYMVFRSEREGGGLFVVPSLGGNERRVTSFGYRPRWSPDGKHILFYGSFLRINTSEIPKVYVATPSGDQPREVLSGFLSEFNSFRVAWRPDGQGVSVWGNHRKQGWGFWTAPLTGASPVKSEFAARVSAQLKEAEVSFSDFTWAPSGRALYFEGISHGVRNLWKVEIEPHSLLWTAGPERMTTGAGLDTDLVLSPDGRRLAFAVRTERTRIWSVPFDAAGRRVKGTGQPVTEIGIEPRFPDLSPDSQKMVFCAQRAGRWELWEKSLKDGRERLLAPDDFSRFVPRWSRDGSRLAYRRSRPRTADRPQIERAIVTTAPGAEEQLLITPGESNDLPYDWSTDGKWILGGTDRQSPGRLMIVMWPIAAAPLAETQMRIITSHPEENLYQARFSPDDRWVSFCSAKATCAGVSTIYAVSPSGGEWTQITEGKYFDDKPRWSPDGRTLYFLSNRTGFFNLWGIGFDPAGGKPIGSPFRVTNFDSPGQMILDDVRFMEIALSANRLILPIMEASSGIWILENL
jgi:Tol biopolymer transport system component/DNA-binding winged helix-turn-helix (wHTH) protein